MVTRANLEIYQGDDFAAVVVVCGEDGTAADLTGCSAQSQIRSGPADTSPVIVEIQATVVSPNYVTLSIPAATTLTLTSRQYSWDLQLTTGDRQTETILAGYAIVTQEVTREAA